VGAGRPRDAGSGGAAQGGVAWHAGTGETPRASAADSGYGDGPDPGYGAGYGGGTDPGSRSASPFDPGYGYTGGPWEARPAAHQPPPPATGPSGAWPAPGPGTSHGPVPHTGPPPPPPGGPGDWDSAPPLKLVLRWTLAFFVVPLVLYLLWAVTRSGALPPGCVEPVGSDCRSPRAEALATLGRAAPGLVGAVLLAVAAAAVLRGFAFTWRPGAIGLAAAVIGAGMATALTTVLT